MTDLRICPACLNSFRTLGRGQLARHGFSAHNVRHGAFGGFHTGSCPASGLQPIGTAAGNALGLGYANGHETKAAALAALPAFTLADAERNAIQEALSPLVKRARERGDMESLKTLSNRMATDTAATFANTSYRGWFFPDSLAYRLRRMTERRAEEVTAHREHAAAIRAAVAANPAE